MTNKQNIVYILLNFLFISQATNGERTKDKMYEQIFGTAACFRRLNSTHQIGCSSNRMGTTGVIHMVNTTDELDRVVHNLTAGPYMVVMPVTLLSRETLGLVAKNPDKISGVVVHQEIPTPDKYSAEAKCPNEGYGLKDQCEAEGWNPWGTGVLQGDYDFPIFLVLNKENLDKIEKCWEKFNNYDYKSQSQRALCSLELNSFMFAAVNSQTCMRRGKQWFTFTTTRYCDPLGDKNIWSTLFPLENKSDRVKDAIFVMTRMDTTSLFNEINPGAHSAVTGLVTLLVTAELMKRMVANEDSYKRNVFFFVLNGESYDYIGSQRLVYDILEDKFPMEHNSAIKNPVPQLHMEDIKLILELGQFGKNGTLYTHYLKDSVNIDQIKEFADILKKNLRPVTPSTSFRLPPSSIQSFLVESPNISALLLTDHDHQFTNPYYNSIYDTPSAIDYQYMNITEEEAELNGVFDGKVQQWLANIAEGVAKSIYKEAMGKEYEGKEKVNTYYVDELLSCYLDTANCKFYKAVSMREYLSKKPLSLYVGVDSNLNLQTVLTSGVLAWLTGEQLNVTQKECTTDPHQPAYQYIWMSNDLDNINSTKCFKTTMNYTLAISPAFEIENYAWTSGRYSSWTESVWRDLSVRMFLRPSMRHEIMTISIGTVILVLSMTLVHFFSKRANVLFPRPQQSDTGPATNC